MTKVRKIFGRHAQQLKNFLQLSVSRIDRESVAATYLKGSGMEIGALHNPLKVTNGTRVVYVDRMSVNDLRRQYPELRNEKLVPVDVIDDGERLGATADETQDFVIANHFLEHTQNPILAVSNMVRVLKPCGIIYLALPDKRYTFDIEREITAIDHLMRDYTEGPDWSRQMHFEEWACLVNKVGPEEKHSHVQELIDKNYSIHYHVWSQKEMIEFVLFLQTMLPFDIELLLSHREETIFILRKHHSMLGNLL